MHTGWGFAGKGTKILRHYGTKSNRHCEGGTATLHATNVRNYLQRHCEERSDEAISLKLQASVQRNVAIASKRSFAFTLSEVLIVLAVLGVVAAMTIPDLIQDYREKALITALKKNYSVFSQAVDMAQAENGSINTWDIGPRGTSAIKLYNILKPYLRIEKTCGNLNGCFADYYEALHDGVGYEWQPATYSSYYKGILVSGTSFYLWINGSGCPNNDYCGEIGVDINGKSGPNKAGVDFFLFKIFADGLEPAGYCATGYADEGCAYNGTSGRNGTACTYWAIKHENMDYLRKAGNYLGY